MTPGNSSAHVSHETSYAAIYAQPRGGLKAAMIEACGKQSLRVAIGERHWQCSSMVLELLRIIYRPEEIEALIIPGNYGRVT